MKKWVGAWDGWMNEEVGGGVGWVDELTTPTLIVVATPTLIVVATPTLIAVTTPTLIAVTTPTLIVMFLTQHAVRKITITFSKIVLFIYFY